MRDSKQRVSRFQSGVPIAEIAKHDGVKPISVYHYLRDRGLVPDTYLSSEFEAAMAASGMPIPEREYQFTHLCPVELQPYFCTKRGKLRQWKSDFAFPWHKLAIEIDGGKHVGRGGSHNNDREKRNAYVVCGWRTLHFDTDAILEDVAACVQVVKLALSGE